jgi:hypothetical protein
MDFNLNIRLEQLALLLVIVAMIFGTTRLKKTGEHFRRSQLRKELGRMPVYSAETTNGKEAEFIRDRLPKRFPIVIFAVAVVVFGAVAWWLTR